MRVLVTLAVAALAPLTLGAAAPPRGQCDSGRCPAPAVVFYTAPAAALPAAAPCAVAAQSCERAANGNAVVPVRPLRNMIAGIRSGGPLFPNLPRNRK